MNKFIDPTIFEYISSADKESLIKMKKDLSKELENGTLIGIKYTKELEFINSRLKGSL